MAVPLVAAEKLKKLGCSNNKSITGREPERQKKYLACVTACTSSERKG
jgi:hypothetical protein